MDCHAVLQGNLPDSGIEPASLTSPTLQADSLPLAPPGKPRRWVCAIYSRRELFLLESCPKSFYFLCNGEKCSFNLSCKQGKEVGKEWVGRDWGLRSRSSGL